MIRSLFRAGMLALLLGTLTSSAAHAQTSPEDEALVFFDRARALFEEGQFELSAVLLRQAIALHDVAPLHYNLGRSLQEIGEWELALEEYRTFLQMNPETDERTRLEARIAQLEARIAEREGATPLVDAPANQTVPTTQAVPAEERLGPEAPPRRAQPAPWITLGLGAAMVGTGAAFAVLFNGAVDDSRAAPDHASALGPANSARTYAVTADVLFAIGGTAMLTGLVWGLLSRRAPPSDRVAVEVGLGTLALEARF